MRAEADLSNSMNSSDSLRGCRPSIVGEIEN